MRLVLFLVMTVLLAKPALAEDKCAKTMEELGTLVKATIPENWIEHEIKEPNDGKPMQMVLENSASGMSITISKKSLKGNEMVKWINGETVEICKDGKGYFISFPNGKPKLDNRPFNGMASMGINMKMSDTIRLDTLNGDTIGMKPSGFPVLFKPE